MELNLWCTVICAHALLMFRRRHEDRLKISKDAENVFHMFHLICTVNYKQLRLQRVNTQSAKRERPSPIAQTNSRKKMAQPTDYKQISYFDAATFPAGAFGFLIST